MAPGFQIWTTSAQPTTESAAAPHSPRLRRRPCARRSHSSRMSGPRYWMTSATPTSRREIEKK